MPQANLFLIFLKRLNQGNFPYMVTGSVASIIYGEPRMTHDIDLVLELNFTDTERFVTLFPLTEFYCPPAEVIKTEISRETDGHFNIIHHETGFKADIYVTGKDQLHNWAMQNRNNIKIENTDIYIAPPEYVIVRKLQYYKQGQSDKHLRDIKKMLEISSENINKNILEQMIKKYDLTKQWKPFK